MVYVIYSIMHNIWDNVSLLWTISIAPPINFRKTSHRDILIIKGAFMISWFKIIKRLNSTTWCESSTVENTLFNTLFLTYILSHNWETSSRPKPVSFGKCCHIVNYQLFIVLGVNVAEFLVLGRIYPDS